MDSIPEVVRSRLQVRAQVEKCNAGVFLAERPDLELVDLVNFSSTYYVATRVLKPLLAQALGSKIDVASPDSEWNRFFSLLPSWGDYGTQKLFVFKKK